MIASNRSAAAERLAGVDAMRLMAFVAVCFVHTARWGRPLDRPADAVDGLTLICRFAVPFFFLASGYFSAGRAAATPRLLKRIAMIFAAWGTLYIALTPGGLVRLLDPRFDLLTLIDGGPGYHLWFLPALVVGLIASRFLHRAPGWARGAAVVAAGLAGAAASAGVEGRIGAYLARYLSAIAYVAAGALWRDIGGAGDRPASRSGVVAGLVAGGLALEGVQAALLLALPVRPLGELEFPLEAAPLGFGALLAALGWTPRSPISGWAARVGRGTLGLYAAHLGVAMLLFAWLPCATLAERLGVFGLTVIMSIGLVEGLRRTPLKLLVE